jgi:predicted PurR-regulated permease PerM
MIGTMIELLLFVIALFTAIIIPVLIESILSVISKMQGLKDDVKEGIFNPISSLRKAPKKISNSAKDIGKFLKKSAKDLKKLSKRR